MGKGLEQPFLLRYTNVKISTCKDAQHRSSLGKYKSKDTTPHPSEQLPSKQKPKQKKKHTQVLAKPGRSWNELLHTCCNENSYSCCGKWYGGSSKLKKELPPQPAIPCARRQRQARKPSLSNTRFLFSPSIPNQHPGQYHF